MHVIRTYREREWKSFASVCRFCMDSIVDENNGRVWMEA